MNHERPAICIVAPVHIDGRSAHAVHTRSFAQALGALVPTHLACYGGAETEVCVADIDVSIARPPTASAWSSWRAMLRLVTLVVRRRPQHVYSLDIRVTWLLALMRRPVSHEAHSLHTGRVGRRLERAVLRSRSVEVVAALSDALADRLRRYRCAPSPRVIVLREAAWPVEPALATDEREVAIGYVGSLYPGRGLELMVELAAAFPDVPFHIVGQLPLGTAIDAPPNMVMHGFVEPARLSEFYRMFDIALAPYARYVRTSSGTGSTAEWMSPMKLFEYMAHGKAIIASDLPAIREVLTDAVDCRLAEPESVEAWSACLAALIADPDARGRLARAGRELHLRRYTWDRRAELLLDELGISR